MKILYNCQQGTFCDMRTTSRDVSVVTRQPLLNAILDEDYRAEIYIPFNMDKPEALAPDIQKLVDEDPLAKALWINNNSTSAKISVKTRFINPSDLTKMKFDLAITELRTKLYFHDSIPNDVALQRKIWKLNCPKIIWDMDMWLGDELPYFYKESEQLEFAKVITPTSDYYMYLSSLPKKYKANELHWEHVDFPPSIPIDWTSKPEFDLGYVGSQYNREDSFHRFITSVAKADPTLKIEVIGKWYDNVKSLCPPNITFSSARTPMFLAPWHLNKYAATIQIAPKYYQLTGTHTYRLAEGLTYGPVLYTDSAIKGVEKHVPPFSLVRTPEELTAQLNEDKSPDTRRYKVDAQKSYISTLGEWSSLAKKLLKPID